jgi:hypothetical protein
MKMRLVRVRQLCRIFHRNLHRQQLEIDRIFGNTFDFEKSYITSSNFRAF